MNKILIRDSDCFDAWCRVEASGVGIHGRDRINSMYRPVSYPCVLAYHWHEDSYSRDWLEYEYVYPSDFN